MIGTGSFLWVSVSPLLLLGESCRCLGSLVEVVGLEWLE